MMKGQLQDGRKIGFTMEEYGFIDHAYCTTLYKAQGTTCDSVLYVADSKTNHSEELYTGMTRARQEARLYVPEEVTPKAVDKLAKNIEGRQEKTSTLDPIYHSLVKEPVLEQGVEQHRGSAKGLNAGLEKVGKGLGLGR